MKISDHIDALRRRGGLLAVAAERVGSERPNQASHDKTGERRPERPGCDAMGGMAANFGCSIGIEAAVRYGGSARQTAAWVLRPGVS
ncbi:MAG: hypothetical protein ACRDPY_02980 [Streptosporangiaceae bacterium]